MYGEWVGVKGFVVHNLQERSVGVIVIVKPSFVGVPTYFVYVWKELRKFRLMTAIPAMGRSLFFTFAAEQQRWGRGDIRGVCPQTADRYSETPQERNSIFR